MGKGVSEPGAGANGCPNRPQRHRAAQSTKQGGVTGLIRIELAKLEKRRLSREYAPVFSEELGITGLVWIKTVWVLNGCRRLRPCERQGESTMAVTMAVRRISHAPPLNPDSPASTVCSSATGARTSSNVTIPHGHCHAISSHDVRTRGRSKLPRSAIRGDRPAAVTQRPCSCAVPATILLPHARKSCASNDPPDGPVRGGTRWRDDFSR